MSERKLLVGPDPDGSTFAKAFSKSARLPTQEDRDAALEQSVAEMRKELYRPPYQPPSFGGPPPSAGRNGWAAEIPIGAPEGIGLIDQICNALSPQPKPRVNIEALKAFEPSVVRAKLEEALAKGLITREQVDAAMSSLKP